MARAPISTTYSALTKQQLDAVYSKMLPPFSEEQMSAVSYNPWLDVADTLGSTIQLRILAKPDAVGRMFVEVVSGNARIEAGKAIYIRVRPDSLYIRVLTRMDPTECVGSILTVSQSLTGAFHLYIRKKVP